MTTIIITPEPTTKRPLYQKLMVMATVMTTIGGTLTGIMTYINVGNTDTFLATWFSSFLIAVLVMMPIGLISMTLIGKLIQKVMPKAKKIIQQLITGLSMALIMESVLAGTTAANTVGLESKAAFVDAWGQGFMAALPIGIIIALVMSLFLKPKLDAFMAS